MNKDYSSNVAAHEQDDLAADETWCSLGDAAQRVVNRLAEVLRRNQLSSPSIIPSDNPDDCDCPPASSSDEREA